MRAVSFKSLEFWCTVWQTEVGGMKNKRTISCFYLTVCLSNPPPPWSKLKRIISCWLDRHEVWRPFPPFCDFGNSPTFHTVAPLSDPLLCFMSKCERAELRLEHVSILLVLQTSKYSLAELLAWLLRVHSDYGFGGAIWLGCRSYSLCEWWHPGGKKKMAFATTRSGFRVMSSTNWLKSEYVAQSSCH